VGAADRAEVPVVDFDRWAPNADRPLPPRSLEGIRRSARTQDGDIITTAVDGFLPLASFTMVLEIV
jgi:hypothetical protein